MPRRYSGYPQYYDSPEGTAFGNFAEGLVGGVERAYLTKQLKAEKEEERKQRQMEQDTQTRINLQGQGYQSVRPDQVMGPAQEGRTLPEPDTRHGSIDVGGVPMELTPYERELREAKLSQTRAGTTAKIEAAKPKPEKADNTRINMLTRTMADIQKLIATPGRSPAPELIHQYNELADELEALTGRPQTKFDMDQVMAKTGGWGSKLMSGAANLFGKSASKGLGVDVAAGGLKGLEGLGDNLLPRNQAQPAQVPPGQIMVISPDGQPGSIPEEDLDEALAQGFTLAE